MAPRKGKFPGKGINIQIKSKVNTQESELQGMKKKSEDEPLEATKWLKPVVADGATNLCDTIPDWFNSALYSKHGVPSTSTVDKINNYAHFRPKEREQEEKSSSSDGSDECDCSHSKYQDKKSGILKRSSSSTHSLVAHYIKSGMDHVASFIVESAIRFGQQHGVVVPDKNTPNLFELTAPDASRKIRFKLPDKHTTSKDRRRVHRQSKSTSCRRTPSPSQDQEKSDPSRGSTPDSLEEIIPLLKKLEEEGGGMVSSELDLQKLVQPSVTEVRDRSRDRMREKYRAMEKRYKNFNDIKNHNSRKYPSTSKNHWKRFKRDSLELGRQRLRGSTSTRKDESVSSSIY